MSIKIEPRRVTLPKKPIFYRPELDVLRFLAFFLVFLAHALPGQEYKYIQYFKIPILAKILVGLAHGGAYGVDLFFCLSSYLITAILLKEFRATKSIQLKAFYIRRILRIWPLYFLVLFIVQPLIGILLPQQILPYRFTLLFTILSGNWAIALWGFPVSALSVLWSVSIEEQFYLVWPLVMKHGARLLPQIGILLVLVAWIARFILVHYGASRDAIFTNTLTRLDPIALGALVAYFFENHVMHNPIYYRISAIIIGMTGIVVCGSVGAGGGLRALFTYPLATVSSGLMLVGILNFDLPVSPLTRMLVYFGRISYGLYVFHGLSLAFIAKYLAFAFPHYANYLSIPMAFLLTIILATTSYELIELWFLKYKDKFSYIHTIPSS